MVSLFQICFFVFCLSSLASWHPEISSIMHTTCGHLYNKLWETLRDQTDIHFSTKKRHLFITSLLIRKVLGAIRSSRMASREHAGIICLVSHSALYRFKICPDNGQKTHRLMTDDCLLIREKFLISFIHSCVYLHHFQ